MRFHCLILVLASMLYSICNVGTTYSACANDVNGSLAEIVLAGIENNYALAPTIRARAEVVSTRPGISEIQEREIKTARGSGRIISYPERKHTLECLLQGDDYLITARYDGYSVVRSVFQGKSTVYSEQSAAAWINSVAEAPSGRLPCDPRAVGLPRDNYPLTWYLRHLTRANAQRMRIEGEEVIQLELLDAEGGKLELSCDPIQNFLPVRIIYRRSTGSVFLDTELTYQQIGEGVFFVKSVEQRIHQLVKSLAVGPVEKVIRWNVTDSEILPTTVAGPDLSITFPKGTSVSDTTKGTFTSGLPITGSIKFSESMPARSYIPIWINIGVVLVLILVVAVRKYRYPQKPSYGDEK